MRRGCRFLLRAAPLAALLAACLGQGVAWSADGPPQSLSWTNPVIAQDFPDPFVTRIDGSYWATSTSSAMAPGFPVMHSTDLVSWQRVGTLLAPLPGWASDSFWAPELVADESGVRAYYTARRRSDGRLCVALATATAPSGPFADRGPTICQRAGSIDPTTTRDAAGRRFLVWKEDGNAIGRPSRIWAQQLSPDGLTRIGPRWVLLENRDPWEGAVVEAPSIVVRGGWTYLFYSGNAYGGANCRYALGVARARSLRGPFVRAPGNPILRSNSRWRCPGHASFFADDAGRELVVYHAYAASAPRSADRYALLDPVTWNAAGWPAVGSGGRPSSTTVLR